MFEWVRRSVKYFSSGKAIRLRIKFEFIYFSKEKFY
jgi:hypothetical protein